MSKNVGIYTDIHTQGYLLPHIKRVLYKGLFNTPLFLSALVRLEGMWGFFPQVIIKEFTCSPSRLNILWQKSTELLRSSEVFYLRLGSSQTWKSEYSYNSAQEIMHFIQQE